MLSPSNASGDSPVFRRDAPSSQMVCLFRLKLIGIVKELCFNIQIYPIPRKKAIPNSHLFYILNRLRQAPCSRHPAAGCLLLVESIPSNWLGMKKRDFEFAFSLLIVYVYMAINFNICLKRTSLKWH